MNKKTLKIASLAIVGAIALTGCAAQNIDDVENSVNITDGNQATQSPTATEQPNGGNAAQQPTQPANPTKPSDYAYPDLPTGDAFAMLAELAKNTTHSTTTLGSLEKYPMTAEDGTVYNVTIAFDPTIEGNNLAVFQDFPDGYEKKDSVISINQLEGENKNIAKWLLGHQVVVLAQSTGLVTAEIKDGYIEVTYNSSGIVDKYYHQDKVIVKRERSYATGEPTTVRTIEYTRSGEVAELIAKIK